MSRTLTGNLSRRGFVQAVAGATSAQLFAPVMHALSPWSAPPSRIACRAAEDGIETLRVSTGRAGQELCNRISFTACESPLALAPGLGGRVLYVAHRTDRFQNLPCGSVGSYRVDARGAIAPLHRERLSLACAQPDALAISPDSTLLAVTSRRAGILNVLPLDAEGRPGAITAVRRELQWPSACADDVPLQLSFVDEHTLIVTSASWPQPSLYRCTLDEISPVRGDSRQYADFVAPSPLPDEAPLVWLVPSMG